MSPKTNTNAVSDNESDINCCPIPKDVKNLGKQIENQINSLLKKKPKIKPRKLVPKKVLRLTKTFPHTQRMAIGSIKSFSKTTILINGDVVWLETAWVDEDAIPEVKDKETRKYETYIGGGNSIIEIVIFECRVPNAFIMNLSKILDSTSSFDLHSNKDDMNQVRVITNSNDYKGGSLLKVLNKYLNK